MNGQVINIINQLPPYEGKRIKIRTRQSITDIMRDILYKHKKNAADCDRICRQFWKGNALDTAKYLFDFCKNNIRYNIENTLNQSVKTISGILVEGQGDCKHYSQFIVGICCALQRAGYPIKAKYRFATYDDQPDKNGVRSGHVFAVIIDRGREIWCDPVLSTFDQRTPRYITHFDKVPDMSGKIGEVWDVSGVNNGFGNDTTLSGTIYERPTGGAGWLEHFDRGGAEMGKHHHHHHHGFFSKFLDSPFNPLHPGIPMPGGSRFLHHIKHHHHGLPMPPMPGISGLDGNAEVGKHKKKRKHHGLHLKLNIHPGQLFKKAAMAPMRNAYLLYLKLNLFHTGSKIQQHILHNPAARAKLDKFWKKAGGNPNKLHTALDQALKVWNKHHKAHKISGPGQEYVPASHFSFGDNANEGEYTVGNPLAIPAVLAAAAPFIKMISGLLKSFGIHKDDGTGPTDDDLKDATDKTIADHNNATDEDGDGNKDVMPDGSVHHGMGVTTKVTKDAKGNQVLSFGADDPTGGDDPSGGDDPGDGGGETKSVTKTKSKSVTTTGDDPGDGDGGGGGLAAFWDKTKLFVSDHKTMFIAGGVVIVGLIVISKVMSHKPATRKRR